MRYKTKGQPFGDTDAKGYNADGKEGWYGLSGVVPAYPCGPTEHHTAHYYEGRGDDGVEVSVTLDWVTTTHRLYDGKKEEGEEEEEGSYHVSQARATPCLDACGALYVRRDGRGPRQLPPSARWYCFPLTERVF